MAFNMNSTFQGLSTLSVGIPSAGLYRCSGDIQLPKLDSGSLGQSQVVVTITQTSASASPILASAAAYGILAGSAITNSVGTSVVNGSLGESPGSTVTGAFTVTGATNLGNAASLQAQNDALAAYNSLHLQVSSATAIPAILDGQTLTPGAYKEASGTFNLAASGAGNLILNGAGVYVFIASSTLVTGAGGVPTITLTNGASASNIYWLVGSSATINSGNAGVFQGSILAVTSITNTLGGVVNGRLLALNGAVTLSAISTINSPTSSGPVTIYTGRAGDQGWGINVSAAALDVLAISLTSAAAVDQSPNVIQTTASVG